MLMQWRKIGARIRALRVAKGLTQDELARTADLSRIYVQKLEAGERVSPSFPALERLARALDATLDVEIVERSAIRKKGASRGR
jgi:transcriptional regulator with XRE-family HTH domain